MSKKKANKQISCLFAGENLKFFGTDFIVNIGHKGFKTVIRKLFL